MRGGASFGPLLETILGDAGRATISGDLAAIERAAARVDDAVRRLPPESRARAQAERVAAEMALARHRLDPACEELTRRAETLAGQEAGEPSERDLTFARLRGELGLCGDPRALADGRRLLRELSTGDAEASLRRDAALAWGDLAWRAGEWRESASAYELAIDVRMQTVDTFILRHTREAELRFASEAAPRAALAHARDGEAWRAAEAIERGRATLMNPRNFKGDGDEDRPAVRALIEGAAARAALVYLVPEDDTGLVIVVRGATAATLELPGLTTAAVAERLAHVVDAAHGRIGPAPSSWLVDVGAWLWDVAMRPLLSAVKSRELVLVACGLTSALPLHAAWRPGPVRRRYVLEDRVIRYAPNARWAGAEAPEPDYRSVLAVANPRNRLPPLRYAEAEIEAIPGTLEVEQRSGDAAERPEILQRWESFDVIHFACHGRASADEPLRGGVVLAHDEVLTAQHVIDRSLAAHPLVILSACETAVIGERLPDEVVSLQSAFLAAGARGVVATLWPVDDELTARLISGFYDELVECRCSPAAALRQSQRRMIAAMEPTAPGRHRGWPAQNDPAARPPHTWAAFTYAGR